MNVILLTTDTTHHRFFASAIQQDFPWRAIAVETGGASHDFETSHPYESQQQQYEQDVLLEQSDAPLDELAPTRCYNSVNEPECLDWLRSLDVDVAVVFGTGRLRSPIIEIPRLACLNLHGGNPEQYRGLDSHLWAIYHRDFENLVTTLHYVDVHLDTGDIVLQSQLKFPGNTQLYQLRSVNTRACVDMTRVALQTLANHGKLPARRQVQRGRYYSAMPSVLKQQCVKKFARYTEK